MSPERSRLLPVVLCWLLVVATGSLQAQSTPTVDNYGDPLPDGALVRLGTTRWRHAGAGTAIAYAPDGKSVVTGGWHGVLKVWDVTNGKELRRIAVKEKSIKAMVFSPDGSKLAVAGAQGRVAIHEFSTGKEIRGYYWTSSPLLALAFSPDGKLLASAGKEATINLFDMATMKQVRNIEGHQKDIGGLAFSPDGKALASASVDGTVRIWDVASGKELYRIRDEQTEHHCVAFNADGTILATGGEKDVPEIGRLEGQIQLWSTASLVERLKQPPTPLKIKMLIAQLDSKGFAERQKASQELLGLGPLAENALKDHLTSKPPLEVARRIEELLEKLKGGPPPPGEIRQTLRAGERCVEAMAFTKDSQILAAADRDGIRFWDPKTGKELPRLACPHGDVQALAFAPNGRSLAFTAGTSLVAVATLGETQAQAGTLKQAETQGHTAEVGGIAFSADGKVLASFAAGEPAVRLWDTSTGRELRRLDGQGIAFSGIAFTADGKALAAGGEKDRRLVIRVFDTAKYVEVRTIESVEPHWLFGLQFSPDGKVAAAVHFPEDPTDGIIHRWDIASGKQLDKPFHWRAIQSPPAVYPDGRTIAAGVPGKAIRVCKDEELQRLSAPAEVWKVVVSPNGKLLASNAEWANQRGSNVRIWDAVAGQELHELKSPLGQAAAMVFASDSKFLATAGQDGTIRLWDTATGQLVKSLPGSSPIICLAFSPDGKRLAAGGADTAVVIWKVEGVK
jgi:WD40 repeat protein